MGIDIHKRKMILERGVGGLSGPAIKPIAIKLVHDVYKTVRIPILGMGGIISGEDAIEFMLAGATAVAIGTGNFTDPKLPEKVLQGMCQYLEAYKFESAHALVGNI